MSTPNGWARLEALSAGLNVPLESITPFLETFSGCLQNHAEISMDPHACGLGVMTHGEGRAHGYRVAQFMGDNGVEERAIQRFLSRAKNFGYETVSFKVEADSRGLQEFSTYFHSTSSLQVAHACLADSGVDLDGVGLMEAVAEVLRCDSVSLTGLAATRTNSLMEKIYFSLSAVEDPWGRLRAAAGLCGLSDSDWAPLMKYRTVLSGSKTQLSLGYDNGALVPGLKLDVQGAPKSLMHEILGSAMLAERVGLGGLSDAAATQGHVSLRLTPGEDVRLKLVSPDTSARARC